MAAVQLIKPDIKYKDSYAEALREGLHLKHERELEILMIQNFFNLHLMMRRLFNFLCGHPPQVDLWLVDGEKFIGIVSLRPKLNDKLRKRGGNISYAIRKSERRKGYGKLLLNLITGHARSLGLRKILVTCHDQNTGSIRIIEGAGGVLQDIIKIPGFTLPERRYWIQL